MGYINHKSKDKINLIKGNIIKLNILDLWGRLISLENNHRKIKSAGNTHAYRITHIAR